MPFLLWAVHTDAIVMEVSHHELPALELESP